MLQAGRLSATETPRCAEEAAVEAGVWVTL